MGCALLPAMGRAMFPALGCTMLPAMSCVVFPTAGPESAPFGGNLAGQSHLSQLSASVRRLLRENLP